MIQRAEMVGHTEAQDGEKKEKPGVNASEAGKKKSGNPNIDLSTILDCE